MSPTFRRRLRGIVGTTLTWSAAGAMTGAVIGAGISLRILWPRGVAMHFTELVTQLAFASGLVGGMAGLAFALLVTLSERRHTLAELKGWRIGTWGAIAAGATALLVTQQPVFAAVCAGFGYGAASFSLAMAKRALVSAPASRDLLMP